ncbi:MAG: RcpC/CpaB family pilus assembly protein [Acidobacteria bacterium]|nr:RcpC/CpaB family pilus assembly protein [Acidobacteriota bacterium]
MSLLKSSAQPKKERFILIIAIVMGLLAGGANWVYLRRIERTKLTVLKAKKRIPAATQVDGSLFEEVTIAGDVPKMKSLFVAKEDFGAFKKATLTETLQPGQLLMLRSFYFDKESVSSPPPGKRAISIKVEDEANAVGYSIRPGHSVDIWGYINGKSELLKKQACVIAVGGVYLAPDKEEAKEDDYKSVTIHVDEKDVECLTGNLWLAGRKTKITLVGDCNPKANYPAAYPTVAQGSNVARN